MVPPAMQCRCESPWAALCPTLSQPLPRGVLWSAGILPAPGVGGRKNRTDTKNPGGRRDASATTVLKKGLTTVFLYEIMIACFDSELARGGGKCGMRNAECGVRKAESRRRKAESRRRKAECGRRNAEGGMRKAECGRRNAEGRKQKAEGGMRNAECGVRKAESRRRKAECGRRNAEGGMRSAECGRQKAEGGRRKAEGGMRSAGRPECGQASGTNKSGRDWLLLSPI